MAKWSRFVCLLWGAWCVAGTLSAQELRVHTTIRDLSNSGTQKGSDADPVAVRSDHLHSRPRPRPDISIDIAANAVGGGRRPGPRDVQLNEPLSVPDRLSIDVPDFDLASAAGVEPQRASVSLMILLPVSPFSIESTARLLLL